MTDSLLSTKLFIPPTRQELVIRPRLIEQLNEGLNRKLTLISAPAGFGKTTLVSEWANKIQVEKTRDVSLAWISIDDGDNDPVRFFTYLIAALQIIDDNIGQKVEGVFHSQQELLVEPILMKLINDVYQIAVQNSKDTKKEFVLIFDDYHLIEEQIIHQTLEYLLKYAPQELHFIIITRIDPPLALSKLRVTNQLVEIRGINLHLSEEEVEIFLNQIMDLGLTPQEISLLETRTEGWIAGLQMAAISLQKQENRHEFIKAFSGDNRFVIDFLVDEVLNGQPEDIRRFIHRTSILDRMCGSLCDAVVNISDEEPPLNCQRLLEHLDRNNLFIVPLDNQREWFRYHHLFSEAVRYGYRKIGADQLTELHLRASQWYEDQGDHDQALKHALAAKDLDRAAQLVEKNALDQLIHSQLTRLKKWLNALPEEIIYSRPWLCIYQAWLQILIGTVEDTDQSLQTAEQLLSMENPQYIVNERDLLGHVSTLKARIALKQGETRKAVENAEQAQNYLADQSPLHAHIAVIKGLAAFGEGKLDAADQALREAVSTAKDHGHRFMTVEATIWLGYIKTLQGRLNQAMSLYQTAIKYASLDNHRKLPGAGSAYIGMALIERERNNLEKAENLLLEGYDLCSLFGNSQSWHIASAFVKSAQGKIEDAFEQIRLAERFETSPVTPFSNLSLEAGKIRLWLSAAGKFSEKAGRWFEEHGFDPNDFPTFSNRVEYSSLAQFLISKSEFDKADRLLDKLQKDAENGGRNGNLIEILSLQALSHAGQGKSKPAIKSLEQALSLAQSGEFLLTFLDQGPPIENLLKRVKVENETAKRYLQKLQNAFDKQKAHTFSQTAQPLIEPLSFREMEVLQLISRGLTNREIASRLYLSQNTIKVHTRNIYGKLGVNNRAQAVSRARDLEILTSE